MSKQKEKKPKKNDVDLFEKKRKEFIHRINQIQQELNDLVEDLNRWVPSKETKKKPHKTIEKTKGKLFSSTDMIKDDESVLLSTK